MNIRDRQILQIALPSIVSNITVPLLGMIDVAIVGHMGSPVYIGAVAVGSMIFNLVYWLFGFLRMGSSGLTSQALGRRDFTEVLRLLVRSTTIALGIALMLILLQVPMKWVATPFASRELFTRSPKESRPTRPTKHTRLPHAGVPALQERTAEENW